MVCLRDFVNWPYHTFSTIVLPFFFHACVLSLPWFFPEQMQLCLIENGLAKCIRTDFLRSLLCIIWTLYIVYWILVWMLVAIGYLEYQYYMLYDFGGIFDESTSYQKLMYACGLTGNMKECRRVLAKDPTVVNQTDVYGMTPLIAVCRRDPTHFEMIKILVEAGADVNQADSFGQLPLSAVCASRFEPATVEFLIRAGALVNARDGDNWTPLMKVCYTTRTDIHDQAFLQQHIENVVQVVTILIENGADVNAQNGGLYPLGLADSQVVQSLLLKHGARFVPLHRDSIRRTAGPFGRRR